MGDRPAQTIPEKIRVLAKLFKEKFEQHLRESDNNDLTVEIDRLMAEIKALGYTISILVHVDENGNADRLQLAIQSTVPKGPAQTLH